jgi:hypothetical protein
VVRVPEQPVQPDKPVERPPANVTPLPGGEPPPPPAPIVPVVDPRPAIRQALRDYEAGYAAKDLRLLQRVWDVPPTTQKQLEQFFPTVREYNVEVRVEGDITVSADRRSATVTAEVRRRFNIGGRSGGGNSKVKFQLEERDGGWRISNINER